VPFLHFAVTAPVSSLPKVTDADFVFSLVADAAPIPMANVAAPRTHAQIANPRRLDAIRGCRLLGSVVSHSLTRIGRCQTARGGAEARLGIGWAA
jgi:hypothetical protein